MGGVAVVVVLVLLGFLAAALDRPVDRERPMWKNAMTMAEIQHALLQNGSPGQELELTHADGEVEIGERKFTAADGVTVVVEEREPGVFCVQGSEDGRHTGWVCADEKGVSVED